MTDERHGTLRMPNRLWVEQPRTRLMRAVRRWRANRASRNFERELMEAMMKPLDPSDTSSSGWHVPPGGRPTP